MHKKLPLNTRLLGTLTCVGEVDGTKSKTKSKPETKAEVLSALWKHYRWILYALSKVCSASVWCIYEILASDAGPTTEDQVG